MYDRYNCACIAFSTSQAVLSNGLHIFIARSSNVQLLPVKTLLVASFYSHQQVMRSLCYACCSPDHLHLFVSATSPKSFEEAKGLCVNLIDTVRAEHAKTLSAQQPVASQAPSYAQAQLPIQASMPHAQPASSAFAGHLSPAQITHALGHCALQQRQTMHASTLNLCWVAMALCKLTAVQQYASQHSCAVT